MKTTRHLPVFKLIDACHQGGCPICTTLKKDERDYFESLLYEHVNNRHFRAAFNKSGGFCGHHANYLLGLDDTLAVVLLYRQILRHSLDTTAGQSGNAECPACEYLRARESHVKSVLWKHIEDEELIEAFQQSGGLCLPHYRQFQNEHLRLPKWFAEYHEQQYEQLFSAANAYVEASNFTLEGSLADSELKYTKVDRQLIETLYGYRGMNPHRTAGAAAAHGRRGFTQRLFKVMRRLIGGRQ